MFTGIIREVSKVAAVVQKGGGNLLVKVVQPPRWKVKAGESVAVNGICSTVTRVGRGVMHFEYMPETLRKTTAGSPEQILLARTNSSRNLRGQDKTCAGAWRVGERLNLERSLKVGDALDGHLVMGHVDGVGVIARIERTRGSRVFRIVPPKDLLRYIVIKGSVAVDGVSLTVVDARRGFFTVALIPYTLTHTNLRERRVGDMVNIETDILAKYAAKHSC